MALCDQGAVSLRLVPLPQLLAPRNEDELRRLEEAHRTLDLYLWLAQRLPARHLHARTRNPCCACSARRRAQQPRWRRTARRMWRRKCSV